MTPLVSIAIPTFNRPHYLKEAVASALAQTYPNLEVLIGDNAATEGTREANEEVARQDPRINYQRNKQNLGMAGNFNALADAARGEFLVAIGDDDRLLPNFVSRLVEAIGPATSVAFSNHYLINSRGDRLEAESRKHTRRYRRDVLPAGVIDNAEAVVWQQSIPLSAALVRSADVRRLRFKENLNTPEIEFFIRLAKEGAQFVFVPEYLAEYRVHEAAATSAGLWSERLVESLLHIDVKPEVEPYKRQFLASMLVNAVSRCLQQGERELARKYLRSEYYPRRRPTETSLSAHATSIRSAEVKTTGNRRWRALKYAVGIWLQGFCANLPASVGCSLYRAVQRVKHRAKINLAYTAIGALMPGCGS